MLRKVLTFLVADPEHACSKVQRLAHCQLSNVIVHLHGDCILKGCLALLCNIFCKFKGLLQAKLASRKRVTSTKELRAGLPG